MGHLERKLDLDAIARVKAGIKIKPEPMKRVKVPRPEWTYRGFWRNAWRHLDREERAR